MTPAADPPPGDQPDTPPGTATTTAARDHARAQGGVRVATMPTVPPTAATDLPDDVDAAAVVWDEVVAGGGYTAKTIARGTRVRLTDLAGDACATVLIHDAANPTERLNVADTVKVQWQAYLGEGAVLLSDQGRALMTIVADTSGIHDTFVGMTTRAANAERYGSGNVEGPHPSARDQIGVSLSKHGLGRADIAPTVTLLKGTRVADDGTLEWQGAPTAAGAHVDLLAETHVLVTIANTPHALDPRAEYTVSNLRVTAWSDTPTAPEDERWSSTPERERAYANTAAHLAGHPGHLTAAASGVTR